MTRATVNQWVTRAKRLMADGDCANARTAVSEAWTALGQYSASLASHGASTGTALYLHKVIAGLQSKLVRQCPYDPRALAVPWTSASPPPSGAPSTADGLAVPTFQGPGDVIFDSLQTTLTTLGMIGAVFGLGYGIYITYKRS